MNLIIQAARFATKAHFGQSRKYTGAPYITHPMRVAFRAMVIDELFNETSDDRECLVAAAWLHDVIEDCAVDYVESRAEFGTLVASLVGDLTHTSKIDHPEWNRAQRKAADRKKLSRSCEATKILKLIDRIDNLREMPQRILSGDPIGDGRIVESAKDSDQYESFKKLYYAESRLLLEQCLRNVHPELELELEYILTESRA